MVSRLFHSVTILASKAIYRWPDLYDMTREELRSFFDKNPLIFNVVSNTDFHLLQRAGAHIAYNRIYGCSPDIFDWALSHANGRGYYRLIEGRIAHATSTFNFGELQRIVPLLKEFDNNCIANSIGDSCPTDMRWTMGLEPTPVSDFLQACYEGVRVCSQGIGAIRIDVGIAIMIYARHWELALDAMTERETGSHRYLLAASCKTGFLEGIDYLLSKYDPPNEGHLVDACRARNIDVINRLLPYFSDISGETFAAICAGGYLDVISMVFPLAKDITQGVDVAKQLMLADVTKFFEPHLDRMEPVPPPDDYIGVIEMPKIIEFHVACADGHVHTMASLFDAIDDDSRESGFSIACATGGLPAVKWFIEHGICNVNAGIENLCESAIYRRTEEEAIMSLLLAQGQAIDRGLISCASSNGKQKIVQMLVAHLTAPFISRLQGVPTEGVELLTYIASICCPVCNNAAGTTCNAYTRPVCRFNPMASCPVAAEDVYIAQDGSQMTRHNRLNYLY
jgi:hypothetical protein